MGASCSSIGRNLRGQLKIQQMAFVLVAVMVFFAMVILFYFTLKLGSLRESAEDLNEKEAMEIVRKLSSNPEFSHYECENCVDLDKVLILKEKGSYGNFWNLRYLQIEKIHPPPEEDRECTLENYPECSKITVVESERIGAPVDVFVSLCRWEGREDYVKCELGRIYASGKKANE